MTQQFRVDGVLLSNAVRLNGITGLPASAWYGEAPTAGLEIDDPDGTLDLRGWHTFTHDETSCVKPRTFSGWLTGRRISRGPYRTGAGRVWECDVIDLNALFSFEVFRASSAKRPEEFDIERVAWAIASAPMAGTPVHDNGRFNTTDNPINFGPADYVTQVPGELFASVAAVSGKNFFAYWDDAAEEISIFYDLVGSNPAAGIAISNVLADVDGEDVFYPYRDAVLDRSPERIATGILFGYQGGNYVYVRDEDLIGPSEFSPTNWRRDEVYRTDRVGRLATAQSLAAQMLADRAVEWDTIRVTVRLPASKVNLVNAGDLVTVRFTHLPGYDPETPLPIIRRNVVPSPGRRDSYDVTLELSIATSNRGPGGGDPGEGPYEPASCSAEDAAIVQWSKSAVSTPAANTLEGASWASPPTLGNLLVYILSAFGQQGLDPGTLAGWTAVEESRSFTGVGGAGGNQSMYYRIADGTEPTTPQFTSSAFSASNLGKSNAYMLELAGVDSFDLKNSGSSESATSAPGVTITPTADRVAFLLTTLQWHSGLASPGTPKAGVTELVEEGNIQDAGNPIRWVGYQVVDGTSGSYDVNPTLGGFGSWASITVAFYCSGGGGDVIPPGAMQVIRNELVAEGDGTTTTFTTDWPYIPGSLRVYVDGVQIINGLTETDPDAGEFQLDFAPQGDIGDTRAELVTATYQAGVGGSGT